MTDRPPLPSPVLTGYQVETVRQALERIKAVFTERYPDCRTLPSVEIRHDGLRWSVSHHDSMQSCEVGHGATPEDAFANLDLKLGAVMTPMERLKSRCEQLMRDAVAMQAHEVVAQLKAARLTASPASSPGV